MWFLAGGTRLRRGALRTHAHLRAIQERENLGDGGIQLRWNHLTNFSGLVESLRQWWVLHDRNFVPAGQFLDFLCDEVTALRYDHGSGHGGGAILQRDCIVRRV